MKITCNLYDDWIAGVRKEMDAAGFDHSAFTDQDCAINWQAWQRRIVPPAKRKILKAAGFVCPPQLQKGLADLEAAIQAGTDLEPWQSKLIDNPSFEDGLYNDYRVVHFHLGVGFGKGGYINRTGELLFAIVDGDSIYELGIYHHGDWYELDLMDIVDANWPQLLDGVTLKGMDLANCPKTREEVKRLREAHVVAMMKLKSNRIIYPLGGGAATDGTSIEAVHSADHWAKFLRNAEKMVIDDIKARIRNGLLTPGDYHARLFATPDEISAVLHGSLRWILWKRPSSNP